MELKETLLALSDKQTPNLTADEYRIKHTYPFKGFAEAGLRDEEQEAEEADPNCTLTELR